MMLAHTPGKGGERERDRWGIEKKDKNERREREGQNRELEKQ